MTDNHPHSEGPPPVIWLLGKTGAGKSSLVRCLTGLDSVQVGNGFESCTATASIFDFPAERPLVRFMDTRGLGEGGYDPSEDLKQCREQSHVVLLVAKIDDPVQSVITDAAREVQRKDSFCPMVLVHTGMDLIASGDERTRAASANQRLFEQALARPLRAAHLAMPSGELGPDAQGIDELLEILADVIPDVAVSLSTARAREAEKSEFAAVKGAVLRYASAAGASDLAPFLGLVSVPSAQAAMLKSLAEHYRVKWSAQRFREFAMAMGTGLLVRFGGGYAARQLARLVPGYGQTVGAVASGAVSFASTYAMGRCAALYLYHQQHAQKVSPLEIRELYRHALREAAAFKRGSKGE